MRESYRDVDVDVELSELLALVDGSDAWDDWLTESSGVEPIAWETIPPHRSGSPCSVETDFHQQQENATTDKRLSRRRRQNRESMARLRTQQKESVESLTAQRAALQRIVHQMLAHNKPIIHHSEACTPRQLFKFRMTELLRTQEELLMEKQQLTEQLQDRRQRTLSIQRTLELVHLSSHLDSGANTEVGAAIKCSSGRIKSRSHAASAGPHAKQGEIRAPSTIAEDHPAPSRPGCWLQFLDDEPPLLYEPLTLSSCATIVCQSLQVLDQIRHALETPAAVALSTHCLGWQLERTREASCVNSKPLLRMRCVKRIPRSRASIQELQDRSWDFLCTPESITRVNHGSVTAMIAQEVDQNTVVLLRNSPDKSGHKLFRYFSLNTRLRTADSTLVLMAITDKEAEPQFPRVDGQGIKWIKHGCSCLRFSIIDNDTVEIEYTGAIECVSEEHATNLAIANCSALFKWEHLVVPPQLLACGP